MYSYKKEIYNLSIEWNLMAGHKGFVLRIHYKDYRWINLFLNSAHTRQDFIYREIYNPPSPILMEGVFERYYESPNETPSLKVTLSQPISGEFQLYRGEPLPPDHPGQSGDPGHPGHTHPPTRLPGPAADEAMEIGSAGMNYQDLFPYIYIRPWPQLSHKERQANFISNDPDSTAKKKYKRLFNNLDRHHSKRLDMENQAILFLEGKPPYRHQAIHGLKDYTSIMEKFLPSLDQFLTLPQKGYPELLTLLTTNMGKMKVLKAALATQNYQDDKERTRQTLWALNIIPGFQLPLLATLTQILVMAKLVETASIGPMDNATIDAMLAATLILPRKIFPLPPANPPSSTTPTSTASSSAATSLPGHQYVVPFSLGQLNFVRYKMEKYQPGEIRHIENVLKGECKEVTRRKLNRLQHSETETNQMDNNQNNENVHTGSDFLNEINRTLYPNSTGTQYTGESGKAIGGWFVNNNPAGGHWQNNARFARDVVARTAKRIRTKVNRTRSTATMDETEDIVVQRFDNTGGNGNLLGIYRWLNKVYSLQTIQQRATMVVEMMIDDPASAYRQNERLYHALTFTKPVSPEKIPLTSYTQINPERGKKSEKKSSPYGESIYYLDLLEKYNIEDTVPPPPVPQGVSLVLESIKSSTTATCTIPDHYHAIEAVVSIAFQQEGGSARVLVGNKEKIVSKSPVTIHLTGVKDDPETGLNVDPDTGLNVNPDTGLPVSIMYQCKKKEAPPSKGITCSQTCYDEVIAEFSQDPSTSAGTGLTVSAAQAGYVANIEIRCIPSQQLMDQWKYDTYRLIIKGYKKQLTDYYKQREEQQKEISNPNPQVNRDLQVQLVQEKCIDLLRQVYQRLVKGEPGEDLQSSMNEPRNYQFFDNALEWNHMSFYFSPRYNNRENYDVDYMKNDFSNFLRAKKARVLVPVRSQFTQIFLYFLSSGVIWPGSNRFAPTIDDAVYLSIISQLKQLEAHPEPTEPAPEQTWTVTIPTDMTLLQKSSELPHFDPAENNSAKGD